MKENAKIHPLLGVDLGTWSVTNYPTTVELREINTGVLAVFPKPYNPQPEEWWRDQARAAIAKARGENGGAL